MMSVPSIPILLVEDNPDLLLTWGTALEQAGYAVATAADAAHALRLAAETEYHVVVVGYHLELIARLCEANPLTVCLLVTAFNELAVGFRANQAGAFNYLVKPFPNEALLEQVHAALAERRRRERMRDRLRVGRLTIDLAARTVTVAGEPVSLGDLEFDLLACLAAHPRRTVGYDELWQQVWGYDGPPEKGVIQRAVSRLREKVGEERVVCIRGEGYRLAEGPPG
jgi:DNA-binding response OmpR family regulator